MGELEIRLSTRQWATIDAGMDNAAQTAAELSDGEQQLAIREAGWNQVPWGGSDRAWPPDQQQITISLEPSQWQLGLWTP